VKFFWVSTDTASDEREVSVVVAGVNGASYTLTTKFTVYKPSISWGPTYSGGTTLNGNQLVLYGLNQLRRDGSPRGGVEISASVDVPAMFTGAWAWEFVQTVAEDRTYHKLNGKSGYMSTNGAGDLLDLGLPYPYVIFYDDTEGQPASQPMTDASLYAMHDTPLQPLATDWQDFKVNELFKTYAMFRPPGTDVCWVPMGMVSWNWYAEVHWDGTQWRGVGRDGPNPRPPVVAPAPPVWNATAQSGTWIETP
jgi:hypothetical protein